MSLTEKYESQSVGSTHSGGATGGAGGPAGVSALASQFGLQNQTSEPPQPSAVRQFNSQSGGPSNPVSQPFNSNAVDSAVSNNPFKKQDSQPNTDAPPVQNQFKSEGVSNNPFKMQDSQAAPDAPNQFKSEGSSGFRKQDSQPPPPPFRGQTESSLSSNPFKKQDQEVSVSNNPFKKQDSQDTPNPPNPFKSNENSSVSNNPFKKQDSQPNTDAPPVQNQFKSEGVSNNPFKMQDSQAPEGTTPFRSQVTQDSSASNNPFKKQEILPDAPISEVISQPDSQMAVDVGSTLAMEAADTPSNPFGATSPSSVLKDPTRDSVRTDNHISFTTPEYNVSRPRGTLQGNSSAPHSDFTPSYTDPPTAGASLWPNEQATSRVNVSFRSSFDKETGDYLTDFYGRLLEEMVQDAQSTMQRLVFQEMDMRKRLYALGNADLFRVRFIEEARWELRERHEVISRREKLERSRIESWLLERLQGMVASGGGQWSEDYRRGQIELEEEHEWRRITTARRQAYKRDEEAQWEAYIMAEDRWRWDVELASRHGMHQIQLDEHRHRIYLETELYPTNLSKLLHGMELEWCDLLRNQQGILYHQVSSNITRLVKDEEDNRSALKKQNKRTMHEFHILHGLLSLQSLEESERELVTDSADRIFAILASQENVRVRAFEDTAALRKERHISSPSYHNSGSPRSFAGSGMV